MIDDKTQSVCKHCQSPIEIVIGELTGNKFWAHVSTDNTYQRDCKTMAEPASKGEPEPTSEWNQEYPRDNRFALWPIPAARPSGPSAPQNATEIALYAIIRESEFGRSGKLPSDFWIRQTMKWWITHAVEIEKSRKINFFASQTSASPCLYCHSTRWKVIAGDGCAVQDRTIPCPHCGPQPVSGDALKVEISALFKKFRKRFNQFSNYIPEEDRNRYLIPLLDKLQELLREADRIG